MNLEVEKLLDLAAEVPSAGRAEFLAQRCPDPAVRAEVESLLEYATGSGTDFDDAIRSVAQAVRNSSELSKGDSIGSYRVASLIGRGGMGSVYLAERADGEIRQKVAVKLIRADCQWTLWRERFLRERQLLSSLNHPSVVHAIDAGHTADGRPFLVMEHVEGVPIDRYAAGIDVRDRLQLFVRVCEGVSHAHRHLIIHRDLKPSNILVEESGQPKLLDFGIAKLLDENAENTQTVERALTPLYASPEQLAGRAQTTATDIYSLGAVLYRLLVGVAPRENTRGIPMGEAVDPSRSNPEVPRDLDFILRKALRREPEDRYVSVDEFASDIRAALEWRPVKARSGDAWYRTRRFLRRYWVPVTAGALVLASLSGGIFLVNRERAIAERRFAEVRQLATKLFDIDVQVAQLPGASKTRQLIVDTALDYLRRVTAEVRMEPGLALELGTAYMRVARVQGVNISANLGQTEQADRTARKAQELIESVLASQPGNRTALLRAAQIAHDRMTLAGDANRGDDALRFARRSTELLNRYLRTGPLNASSDHAEAQQAIIAFINIAQRYMKADLFDDSMRSAGQAIEIARATNWPTQEGAALMIVARANRAKGNLERALEAIRESVHALEPADGEMRAGRMLSYSQALYYEGQILGEDGAISLDRPIEAAACFESALKIGEEFARRDASDFQSLNRVFASETKLAATLRHTDPGRSAQLYDDALERLARAKSNAGTPLNEVATLIASTYPLQQLGKRAEARKRLDAAFDRLRGLRLYPSEKVELGSHADDALRALAQYEAGGGNVRQAAEIYDDLLKRIYAADSKPKPEASLEDAVELSNLYKGAAPIYRRAGLADRAGELQARRLALWQHWDRQLPNNTFVVHQLESARAR